MLARGPYQWQSLWYQRCTVLNTTNYYPKCYYLNDFAFIGLYARLININNSAETTIKPNYIYHTQTLASYGKRWILKFLSLGEVKFSVIEVLTYWSCVQKNDFSEKIGKYKSTTTIFQPKLTPNWNSEKTYTDIS